MNLKEAFRFQNKLQALSDEVNAILGEEKNVVTVKNTFYVSIVNGQANALPAVMINMVMP